MPDTRESERSKGTPADVNLAFAAVVLAHSGCDEGPVEVRLADGSLLQWCVPCGDVKTFVSRGA